MFHRRVSIAVRLAKREKKVSKTAILHILSPFSVVNFSSTGITFSIDDASPLPYLNKER